MANLGADGSSPATCASERSGCSPASDIAVPSGVREAIVKGSADEIRKAGRAAGFCRSFREVGLQKLFRGETTVQEVLRMLAVAPASP